jgi:hypothetical protein
VFGITSEKIFYVIQGELIIETIKMNSLIGHYKIKRSTALLRYLRWKSMDFMTQSIQSPVEEILALAGPAE